MRVPSDLLKTNYLREKKLYFTMKFIGVDSGELYESQLIWCGKDGELLNVKSETPDKNKFIDKQFNGFWRYKFWLPPIKNIHIVGVGEAITPLVNLELGGKTVAVKLDYLFLTGSYKDRGAAVLMSWVKQLGIKEVVQDSSGNAGASIAAYAALAGIKCTIFVPQDTSPTKLVQIKATGANLVKVPGTREDAAYAALQAAKNTYYASHCYNPVFFEGTKTFLFEVFEQLNFKMPDVLVLPAGNGTLILGCYIAAKQLIASGLAEKMPKIIAVQAQNCAPLAGFLKVKTLFSVEPTLAEGIAVKQPVRLKQMAEVVKNTGGEVITVTENEIKDTWKMLALKGFMIEPTSAATISGTIKYNLKNVTNQQVVTLFSGNGLKAADKWLKVLKLL
jgi:threonine synthase